MRKQFQIVPKPPELLIAEDTPITENPLMTEQARVESDPPNRFIEYGPEDESWRRFFEYVRYETRPRQDVLILNFPDPITGRLMQAIVAHPETAKQIRQLRRVIRTIPTV
jgi:hypothetical protein